MYMSDAILGSALSSSSDGAFSEKGTSDFSVSATSLNFTSAAGTSTRFIVPLTTNLRYLILQIDFGNTTITVSPTAGQATVGMRTRVYIRPTSGDGIQTIYDYSTSHPMSTSSYISTSSWPSYQTVMLGINPISQCSSFQLEFSFGTGGWVGTVSWPAFNIHLTYY